MTLVLIPPGSAAAGEPVLLEEDEVHHLKVRRIPAGSAVGFVDGAGARGTGQITARGRGLVVTIDSIEQVIPPVPITLGVGGGDRDRFAWLVEKATELGVSEIVPLETERTRGVATGLRPEQLEKLRRRAREVLKQCGGAWAPLLQEPQPLDVFLRRTDPGARWLLAADGKVAPALDATSPAIALVGPEGGLSDAERAAAVAHGFIPVLAGPLTLRFETAALAAAVLIQASRHR